MDALHKNDYCNFCTLEGNAATNDGLPTPHKQ